MKTRILLFLCLFGVIALNVKAEDGRQNQCSTQFKTEPVVGVSQNEVSVTSTAEWHAKQYPFCNFVARPPKTEGQLDMSSMGAIANGQHVATTSPAITKKQLNLNYAHHSFCVALPVATVGFALMPDDKYIADGVQAKLPGFEAKLDDYLQYAPWAAHLAMGAFGVKGVSKNRWQVLTADAMAR